MNDGEEDIHSNSSEPHVSVEVITDSLCNGETLAVIDGHDTVHDEGREVLHIGQDELIPLQPAKSSDEDTKNVGQYVIVTSDNTAMLGVSTLEPLPEVERKDGEPAYKRYRMQGQDGQSYIFSFADDVEEQTNTTDCNEHQYQMKQDEVTSEVAAARNLEKRNQLLKSDISQAWFTTRDDKNILQSSGATWKQGQWSKDEVDLLQLNISEYCREHHINDPTEIIFEMTKDDRKQFYRTIAKGLQRPLFSVYRRVTRMYDQKNHMGKYSSEEKIKLKELRAKHGNDWTTIGQVLGRSASSVKDKCRLMKDTCNSGKWLPEEEKRLTQAVYDLVGCSPGEDIVHGLSWAVVAEKVITRSEKQCRTKWLNYMNWKMKGGKEWTREEDMNLIIRVADMDVTDDSEIDWDELAKNWDSARSPQWLRGKWWALKRHIPDYGILPFKDPDLDVLADLDLQCWDDCNNDGGKELLDSMKHYYLHCIRVRNNTSNSTARTRKILSTGDTLLQVPISFSSLSTGDGSGLEDIDPTVAYEVLQELPNGAGSYIIAGPDGSHSLQTTLSEHMIVQTLPVSQITGQSSVVIRIPSSSSDLSENSLETSDLGTTIQLTGSLDHSQQELEGLTEGSVISQTDSLTDDSTFNSHDLEEAVISSPVNVVIDIKREPYVQSAKSNVQLMTSFSDPMLNSDSIGLMGSGTDVDTELAQMSN